MFLPLSFPCLTTREFLIQKISMVTAQLLRCVRQVKPHYWPTIIHLYNAKGWPLPGSTIFVGLKATCLSCNHFLSQKSMENPETCQCLKELWLCKQNTRIIFCISLAFHSVLHHQTTSPTEWARISNMTHIPHILLRLRNTQGSTDSEASTWGTCKLCT